MSEYGASRRTLRLLPANRFTLDMLFKELDFHDEQLIAVQQKIKAFAKTAPRPSRLGA